MHRSLVTRALKSSLDLSFSDYLLKLRVTAAQQLLADTDMSLSAVAERVGYTNYISFKRAFVRYTGDAPKAYREHCRGS